MTLEEQILQRWGKTGDWMQGGIDRAKELAILLRQNGINSLDDIRIERGRWDTEKNKWLSPEEKASPRRVLDDGNEVDTSYDAFRVFINGKDTGYLGDINRDGSYGTNGRGNVIGDMIGWSSAGKGHVNYLIDIGPNGEPIIAPRWGSSSDAADIRQAALGAAAVLGGGMVLDKMLYGAVGGGMAAANSGAGLLGGAQAASLTPQANLATGTIAPLQGGASGLGLNAMPSVSIGAGAGGAGAAVTSASGTGFSLGNLFSGFTLKDGIGLLGGALQYVDGRRREDKAIARSDQQRAEDRAERDAIRQENRENRQQDRQWQVEDRNEQRAYNEGRENAAFQRRKPVGNGLLGLALKRKAQ